MFENSIVCLVVFVCCFLAILWGTPRLPVVGVVCFCDASFGVFCFGQIFLNVDCSGFVPWFLFGEFDPGSGRTLAACLTHASRTMKPSGGLVANG